MSLFQELHHRRIEHLTRRHFLRDSIGGLGAMWLASQGKAFGKTPERSPLAGPLSPALTHHAPKAKRVIFLHMAGAPSQLELFEHKPELAKLDGLACPQEFMEGARFAFITGTPNMLGPQYEFHQAGQSGHHVTSLLPHLEKHIDDLCFIRSMQTDQFNHAPAQLTLQTGSNLLGSPSMGAWAGYGLGTENQNLPGFVVLVSGGQKPDAGKSAWGSGYLPSVYQGVQCRSKGDPILYLQNPDGVSRAIRRKSLDALARLNERIHHDVGDPEVLTRINQYELAFRMQMSATEAFDLKSEKASTLAAYGAEPGGESFANNCLLARRLAERGTRFIQLFDWGWDHHGTIPDLDCRYGMAAKCGQTDRPVAALLEDLKQRGMLEETLVVWGGEFGRTPMKENRAGNQNKGAGRDHHKDAFTIWMAGGGVKGGYSHGATDPIGFRVTEDPTSVHDLHATLLHLLGLDHHKLTFPYQGADQRLTNLTKVGTRVIRPILA